MKNLLIAIAIATASIATTALAADVAVSISIGQPGFYGRIDIGGYPAPQVIYREPSVVRWVSNDRPPIYLRIPPGHIKHWSKHCHKYNACGERVYFVHDDWYQHEYVPRYQERHHEYRDDYRDDRRDEGRGHRQNKGHGNKHHKGHDRD